MATKKEPWEEYNRLLFKSGVSPFKEINSKSNKETLNRAIECLKCPDERLDDYLVLLKLREYNMYKAITANPNWKLDSYSRAKVYFGAKRIFEILDEWGIKQTLDRAFR